MSFRALARNLALNLEPETWDLKFMSSISIRSADVALRTEAEVAKAVDATTRGEPWTFSIVRLLLAATLIGAPWAYAAMVTWAWVALGLLASLALFLWAV